ncbi:hypothetical protein Cgig2_015614 [Carnegiea gigantea]|uniref:Pectinesterase inhibitor domain-containing protein n=1 Tax=Carnegiea gigantea TaxID=171969 RepID=A0A9Q1GY16_9CARY|nr:hypothetical protein Cgig2_015614 [Carnegiea gigantea]
MTSLYAFFSVLLVLVVFPSSATGDLINRTCKHSSSNPNIDQNFCVYALQAFPASRCANLTQLGLISITLVKNNVTDTRCLVKRFLEDKKSDKGTKAALKDCLELYSDSADALSDASKDLKAGRFSDANIKVSSVMDASTTCGQGFDDLGVSSPLKNENGYIFQLSAITLSIIKIMRMVIFSNCRQLRFQSSICCIWVGNNEMMLRGENRRRSFLRFVIYICYGKYIEKVMYNLRVFYWWNI